MIHRRAFLIGLIAAPAIVQASSLMKVRGIIMPTGGIIYVKVTGFDFNDGRSPLFPVRTLQRAYELLASGGLVEGAEIHVGPGNYDGWSMPPHTAGSVLLRGDSVTPDAARMTM
jgi:hypothetical protein